MNMFADMPPNLSGQQQLERLVDLGLEPPMLQTLGIRFVEIADGRVALEGAPGKSVYGPIGIVHGGYAATLLDSACACALQTRLRPGQTLATLELKVAYHRPITVDTGTVRAEGHVLNLSRRTGYAEATVVDAAGRLLASATSTLLIDTP